MVAVANITYVFSIGVKRLLSDEENILNTAAQITAPKSKTTPQILNLTAVVSVIMLITITHKTPTTENII
jgi:hypothetical protein